MKFYSNSFRFDISIVQCLGVYFFYRTSLLSGVDAGEVKEAMGEM